MGTRRTPVVTASVLMKVFNKCYSLSRQLTSSTEEKMYYVPYTYYTLRLYIFAGLPAVSVEKSLEAPAMARKLLGN
jgi:hypothetical protein